jgi:hypothetical protein
MNYFFELMIVALTIILFFDGLTPESRLMRSSSVEAARGFLLCSCGF